ncbi:hypothetical protein IV286_05965 [Enterococcus faecium]|nr:hypothetical protein [Enterococcus faecium]MCD5214682.1 hypothetical protein [Enterococcus faecium]MCD5224823.1 hypothetical protein [Enterococcus faecium]
MEVITINNELISGILVALIGFLGAVIGGKYSTKSEKQVTSRLIFDKAYSKIFILIEDNFYNKNLSDQEISNLGRQIYDILENADGYYYPSLKQYASWMFDPKYNQNLQELWHSFCWTFDRQYEKTASEIGLPPRSRYYRMNKNQYSSKWNFLKIYFFSRYAWADFLLIIILIALLILFKIPQ